MPPATQRYLSLAGLLTAGVCVRLKAIPVGLSLPSVRPAAPIITTDIVSALLGI